MGFACSEVREVMSGGVMRVSSYITESGPYFTSKVKYCIKSSSRLVGSIINSDKVCHRRSDILLKVEIFVANMAK